MIGLFTPKATVEIIYNAINDVFSNKNYLAFIAYQDGIQRSNWGGATAKRRGHFVRKVTRFPTPKAAKNGNFWQFLGKIELSDTLLTSQEPKILRNFGILVKNGQFEKNKRWLGIPYGGLNTLTYFYTNAIEMSVWFDEVIYDKQW